LKQTVLLTIKASDFKLHPLRQLQHLNHVLDHFEDGKVHWTGQLRIA
jgi:hypothetical protein